MFAFLEKNKLNNMPVSNILDKYGIWETLPLSTQ